jgi:hypothetical protein
MTPENVRKDSAFREGAVAVGLTFLWASDVGDRESDEELKQLIYQVNEVFDPVQVYFWLHKSVAWQKTSDQIFGGKCSLDISDEVHTMFPPSDLPIIVIRDIPMEGTEGFTCQFGNCLYGDWRACSEYYPQKSYIILDPATMRNATMNYRILTHEMLHVLLLEEQSEEGVNLGGPSPTMEYMIYRDFRVDDPSCTVIVSDYKWIRQSAQDFFSVPLPANYDAFN